MKLLHLLATLTVLLACGCGSAPVMAQSTRTWVSGLGDDINPCTRVLPCKTFAGANSKTAAGGEINCVDAGGYGALTITKALSIICSAGEAGVLVSGTNGITIAAGSGDQILLDGLDIEGIGTGLDGIDIQSAAEVAIENCNIHHFSGNGVTIATSTSVRVIIRNSTIGANAGSGVVVNSTHGAGHVRIFESMIHANTNDGVQVNGAGNDAIISNDEILANSRQLNVTTGVIGGVVYSLGNNLIPNSSGDNPTALALK